MKTIVVIGAGASCDFRRKAEHSPGGFKIEEKEVGFPTGEALVERMIGFEKNDLIQKGGLKSYLELLASEHEEFFQNPQERQKFVNNNHDLTGDGNSDANTFFKNFIHPKYNGTWYVGENEDQIFAAAGKKAKELHEAIKITAPKTIAAKLGFTAHVNLAKLLKFYNPSSIDNFLTSIERELIDISVCDNKESKENLVKAGKELIAYYILKAENKNIFDASYKIWYRWFREAIINSYANKSFNEAKKKKPAKIIAETIDRLQIINFNYDRSLMHFLDVKMPKFSGEIKEKIFCPYGSLGGKNKLKKKGDIFKSAWESKGLEYEYGKLADDLKERGLKEIFDDTISKMAKNIYVIGELERRVPQNKKTDKLEKEFQQKILNSASPKNKQKIYFLGFGFIEDNLFRAFGAEEIPIGSADNGLSYQGSKLWPSREIFYTNFDNHQKIEKIINRFFNGDKGFGSPDEDERIRKNFVFTKSTIGLYDALERDFPLII